MINQRLEELAALHAMNLLDEAGERELLEAARLDPEIGDLIREFAETAAFLAHDAPAIAPPPQVKAGLMRRLPTQNAVSKIISFPQWLPYAVAAGLMALGIVQALQVINLDSRVRDLQSSLVAGNSEIAQLRQSNAMKDLRLAVLEEGSAAQANPAYTSSRVVVAWDPIQNRGVVSMRDLPAPPAGHDYQLWVLDPNAPSPVSAGLITGSRSFAVQPVSTPHPGFAVSLEPSGGSPAPTGPVLFAVAPEH